MSESESKEDKIKKTVKRIEFRHVLTISDFFYGNKRFYIDSRREALVLGFRGVTLMNLEYKLYNFCGGVL